MDVEDLRPDWCPPLPPIGGFDPWTGDLRCPWCMGEYPLDADADPDACPGCGRAIMICGRELVEIGEPDEDAVVLALRTDADARYLHWRMRRIENAARGLPAPDPLLFEIPLETENDR